MSEQDVRRMTPLEHVMEENLSRLAAQNYSTSTLRSRQSSYKRFLEWARDRELLRVEDITRPLILSYQRFLHRLISHRGKLLSVRVQYNHLVAIRLFFSWLTKQERILSNPAADLELPKVSQRIPRNVLTRDEVECVFRQPNVHTPIGLRDRCILELLYSTGMRRMEVAQLWLMDVDVERGQVLVREGKGRRDRMIPIGERALLWMEKYIAESRRLHALREEKALFVSTISGAQLAIKSYSQMVKNYVMSSGIEKEGACHIFRHTMATLMLENGADIRFIQEILGHQNLSTTQIYTRVSITKLKEVHEATHPAAFMVRTKNVNEELVADETMPSLEALC